MVAVAVEDVARTPAGLDVLKERVDHLEELRDESSRRLHLEIEKLRQQFEASQSHPVEIENIRFPPRMVAGIIAGAITVFGGMYASTYGIRSDVRDILTTIANQTRVDEVNQKLADQQTTALKNAIDVIDRRQQLQQIEIQDLKEMVLRQGVTK